MRKDEPGAYSLDTLRSLPVPDIYERDPQAIKARMIAFFEEATGRTLYDGQVEMYLIETWAYGYSLAMEEAQAQALQYLVAFSAGDGLDALGANRSIKRLDAAQALVRLRFTPTAPLLQPLNIPPGFAVRVSDGDTQFVTLESAVLPVGGQAVETDAIAAQAGAGANGLPAGSINVMLSPVAGVAVSNISISDGGADRESDDAYRLRIANAPERISRAGPGDAYRETVMSVSAAIIDCAVVRPAPCYIDIYILTAQGSAGDALSRQVMQALDPETMRPMGDEVTIRPCEPLSCTGAITVRAGTSAAVIGREARSRVDAVTGGWRERLGGVIAPSDLAEAVKHIAGVIDVQVDGPDFQQLAPGQYMDRSDITIDVELVQQEAWSAERVTGNAKKQEAWRGVAPTGKAGQQEAWSAERATGSAKKQEAGSAERATGNARNMAGSGTAPRRGR